MLLSLLVGVGVVVGSLAVWALGWVKAQMAKPSFRSSGFEYARCGPFTGWLSRDWNNNDWIIWCVSERKMYRGSTPDAFKWTASPESEEECRLLGCRPDRKGR